MDFYNEYRSETLVDIDIPTSTTHEEDTPRATPMTAHADLETDVDLADSDIEDEDAVPDNPVFSLTAILLDSSDALQAAKRMYASSHSGLRFFSDFRRVVPTSQLQAEQHEDLDDDELDVIDPH